MISSKSRQQMQHYKYSFQHAAKYINTQNVISQFSSAIMPPENEMVTECRKAIQEIRAKNLDFRKSYTQWLERQTEGIAETIMGRAIGPKISTFIKILSPRICFDYRILSYTLGKLQNRQRNMCLYY
jgi:hypothetical protein